MSLGVLISNHFNRTLQSENKGDKREFAPTIIVVLIACLSGTILLLLIIIGFCLVRGSPGYVNAITSKENNNLSHTGKGNYYSI